MIEHIRQPRQPQTPARQRGVTLFGLLFWAVFIAVVVLIGAKVVPTVSEYMACVKGAKLAASEVTPDAARQAFDRYTIVGYISSISGKDLDITTGNGGSLRVSFDYDKEIPLAGPVSLLIKYHGSSNGTAAP